ncbi:LysR family transcriptional regulator [Paenibacillus turicensis]|uniref:LysR family transcriptional regulator n=1 Tax=Paenibacillus turicensis TaxID=160487 RepID=UPI003D28D8BD
METLESSDLKIFQAVAKAGSITKAAQMLNYVQSNVTTRIQALETELGVPLFYRSNRGMSLTPAGEGLLTYADQIIALLEEAFNKIKYSDSAAGSLKLGSIETAVSPYLLPILKTYQADFPNVQVILTTGSTHDLLQKVRSGELHGAFIYGEVQEQQLNYHPLFEDELVLISEWGSEGLEKMEGLERLEKSDRLERIDRLDRSDSLDSLLSLPMLFFEVGCTHQERVEQLLRDFHINHLEMKPFGTMEVIVNSVSAGLGISLLPYSAVKAAEQAKRISCHSLPEAYRKLEIGFVYRSESNYFTSLTKLVEQLITK